MKITATQLRRIIREEIDQAARKKPKAPARARKPKSKSPPGPRAIAAQVADIVGKGYGANDFLGLAEVVYDHMSTPLDDRDPEDAYDAVAEALNLIDPEAFDDDDVDEICIAFNLNL